MSAPPLSPRRFALPALLALCFALSLALARSLPLIDPDEGRNAEVAREMAESGDVIVPRLGGMPYLDKPPALFAASALALRAFGLHPWAARLPAALSALALLAILAHAGWRLGTTAFAVRAVLLTAAAPLFATLSAYVIFDMPLALCVTTVWVLLAVEAEVGASPARRAAMFGAVALGVLVKGPVMLAWAAGGSLGAAALLRSRGPLRWLAWWPGWLGVLAVAGGWFALATARHPEYPRYAFLEESLERMTSGSFKREQPGWFALAVIAGGALPWSLATPWGAARAKRAPAGLRRSLGVALGFVLFALVFFTLSRSKLVTYLLPAIPPLAWVAAAMWGDSAPRRRAAWVLGALYAALAVAAGAYGAALLSGVPFAGGDAAATGAARALGAGFACAATLALASLVSRRRGLDFAAALAFTPLLLVLGHPLVLGYARTQSGAPLAEAVRTVRASGAVRYEGCYSPGTDFLLGARGEVVSESGRELTSNYQVRYRDTLKARGHWTVVTPSGPHAPAAVVVRPAADGAPPPAGFEPMFRDSRFIAFRRLPPR